MGLSKRDLKEIFYRLKEGLVGKVFVTKRSVYIPDLSALKNFSYYFENRSMKGSIYYFPVLDGDGHAIGVLKLRKIFKDSFTDIERSVLQQLQREIGIALLNIQKFELLNAKSYVDELTHLFNRRYYNEHFPKEFKRAQRYQHDLSIMFVDIDNFKEINDQFGHAIGDTVLRSVSSFIRKITRGSDLCIRYGGDEFLIILPETNRKSALDVGTKLQGSIEAITVSLDGDLDELIVNLSIGISSYPEDTIEPKMLVELADRALYEAKKSGKNQIVMASALSE
jgi:diguanylate cyclase (GGDEF)-like protein